MSTKFSNQNIINEKGRRLFSEVLDPKFFFLSDFSEQSGQDSCPDIDGHIRLRDGQSFYLNLYLHYQLKSTNNLRNEKYYCSGRVLDYFMSTNVPTLLIVADTKNGKVYWVFIDENKKKKLRLKSDNNSGITMDISPGYINQNEPLQLNQTWQRFAKKDDYAKLNDAVDKITVSFHQDIHKCLGILYLLQRISKKDLVVLFSNLFQIPKDNIELIIQQLIKESVVSVTANFYILDNEQLGIESFYELLEEIRTSSLVGSFKGKKDKQIILRQLAKIEHIYIQDYFIELANDFLQFLKNPTNNNDIFVNLEFLQEYAFRIPKKTLKIIKVINNIKPIKVTKTYHKGLGLIEGKSYYDLLKKCIEICDGIRYAEKEVFNVLVDFANSDDKAIGSEALRVLQNICKYNIHILRKVGYDVQLFILEKLEKWDNKKIVQNANIIISVCTSLLELSFEGTSMQDYKTFTFHSGGLNFNLELKDIRKRTIEILKKVCLLNKDLATQKKTISVMELASHTPNSGNYGNDIEQMVVENTNYLIKYYLSILSKADNEIIKNIEEQSHWFSRRFNDNKLPRLNELKTVIASKTEYDMFRVFVGYDGKFDEDMDWDKARNFRNEKIQEFINDINDSNFTDWEKKILLVIKNYSTSDPGEFQYFNFFLYELSKQKPEIAVRLIGKSKLESFLIHIIAGLWSSRLQKEVRNIIIKWTQSNKNLAISAYLFDYVDFFDGELLKIIFNKSRQVKDVQALNNIIRSIIKNYPKNKNLKNMFIKTIKELKKSNNYFWVNNIWYRSESILNDFNEKDFDDILKNLLMIPSIQYHVEEILLPIAEKYPAKIINFFYERIIIKSKRKRSINDKYDAIPFNFHKINLSLRQHETVILPMIFSWYNNGNSNNQWLLGWEASNLIEDIFPSFSLTLESTLANIINGGQKNAIQIVSSILSKYKGQDFLWGTVKAIINKHAFDKDYKDIEEDLFGCLSHMGVVSGEYGFVEALQKKKEQIQQYKNNESEAVKVFVQNYENYLNQGIDYQRKLADEEIELRKKMIS